MNDKKLMNLAADNIRILAASMVEKAKSGHPGGAMGGADFINVLFSEFLVYDPEHPEWEGRDRFFLDPGHMSPMLYATLALTGKFTIDELKQYARQYDYLFLSPIFDSISKQGYQSAYTTEELQQAATQGILSEKTYALGGISLTNLPTLRRLGFQGAAILGDLWSRPTPTILPHFLACLAESKK